MSENNYVEEVTIQDVTYKLRTRLGWYETNKVTDKTVMIFYDPKSKDQIEDWAKSEELVPGRVSSAEHDLERLKMRLIGVNRNKLKTLPSAHVRILLKHIEIYEKEQGEEEKELMEGNPTGLPSTD